MRGINYLIFTSIFYAIGLRPYMALKIKHDYNIYPYLPSDVRQALKTHDHRYLANFDPNNPEHELFDEKTGKGY